LVLRFLRLTTTEGIAFVRLNMKNDSPTFQTTFYITESSAYRNKVLYFRQDDWATLCRPLIDRLASGTFKRIPDVNPSLLLSWNLPTYFGIQSEAIELLRQRKLGFSLVRLLPKDTGVRPIVNLRRRPTPKVRVSNARMAFGWTSSGLLCCWKVHQPDSSGRLWYPQLWKGTDSDFNSPQTDWLNRSINHLYLGHLYSAPMTFTRRLRRSKPPCLVITTEPCMCQGRYMGNNWLCPYSPRLYFVKVDVQACFDSIDQTKLLHILRDLISEVCG